MPTTLVLDAPRLGGVLRPQYPIESERLLLRPLVVADAEALQAYQGRADVCRYIPYEPRSVRDLQQRLASPELTRSSMDDAGQAIVLGVVRRADGVLGGDVMLAWTNKEHRSGEIGYVFNPDFHGNGYATEAGEVLLHLAFDELDLHRVIARVDARNTASSAVLHRLGMRQEAYLRENEWFKGEWTDEIDFAILAAEWRARRTAS
jgi:RimJ/RimL family protein N-acetyltransferase